MELFEGFGLYRHVICEPQQADIYFPSETLIYLSAGMMEQTGSY